MLPKRWIIERNVRVRSVVTVAWLATSERYATTVAAFLRLAMIRINVSGDLLQMPRHKSETSRTALELKTVVSDALKRSLTSARIASK